MTDVILNDTLPLTEGIWGCLQSQTKVTTIVSCRTFFCQNFEIDETDGLSLNTVTVAYKCRSPSWYLYVN
jgi:hypothetical protein